MISLLHRLPALRWVLLAPFLLSLLMSPATMLSPSADGGVAVVICTGDGPLHLVIDPATGEPVPNDDGARDSGCGLNAARGAAILSKAALPDGVAMMIHDRLQPANEAEPAAPARFARPPARAPPVPV